MERFRNMLVLTMHIGLLGFLLLPLGDPNCQNQLQTSEWRFHGKRSQPIILTVDRLPLEVEYFHEVNVTAVVENATTIAHVALHFRTEAGSWQIQAMTNASPDTFWGMIPPQAWRSHVEYYINATDRGGQFTIADNASQYYGYRVADRVPPRIEIARPRQGEHYVGVVTFDMEFSDPGSDIDYYETYLNGEPEGPGYSDDYTGSRLLPDGAYTLLVYVYDCAGNRAEAQVSFSVENPPVIPVIVLELAGLGSVIGICVVVGALLSRKEK